MLISLSASSRTIFLEFNAIVHTSPDQPEQRGDTHAAAGRIIPDVIAPELKVLFCGINPGLYSGATGYHFARPGNRFWPALCRAGFMESPALTVRGTRWFNLAGMAWVYRKYNKDKSLLAIEGDARQARRGLWTNAHPVPPWEFRAVRG